MSSSSPKNPRNWSLWLGIAFFGLVGVALLGLLGSFLWQNAEVPPATDPEAVTDSTPPPTDLRSHQQWVSKAVSDLGREVLIGDSPTRGNPAAEVVLLEFSDFQCPFCARATDEVNAFMAAHEAEVLHVYKHLPLVNIHPEAVPAALAAWAAGQQNQFWAYHDALFANQEALGEALYVETAEALGLDLEQFNRDRASEAAQAAIARDLALASELQLQSTPTFIMNDLLIPGAVPQDFFSEALRRLQAALSQPPANPEKL